MNKLPNLFEQRFTRSGHVVRHLLVRSLLMDRLEDANWEPGSDGGFTAAPEKNEELYDQLVQLYKDARNYLLDFVFTDVHLVRAYVMRGYDDNVVDWHNDRREGHNVTVAIHFSDLTEESGGHFQLQDTAAGVEYNVIPSKGLAILFSHAQQYNHRVTPLQPGVERTTVFFDCIAVSDELQTQC